MSDLKALFRPGKIGTMGVKNRIIMAPMGEACADSEGFILDRAVDYYAERAKGGVGLIIAQSSQALRIGRSPRRPGTWDDKFIPGLAKVAKAVHEHDCKISWQVVYHGKLLLQWIDEIRRPWETRAIAPSAVPWVRVDTVPEEATKEDIKFIIDHWSEAARRVRDAGFDAVEIHGAHGYAVTQWLSPRDNKRTDEYGGNPKNSARFACELIAGVRRKVGSDFPITFRFSASDFMPGGITLEQSREQAPLFVQAGADALNVSAGESETTQWMLPCYLFPDGPTVHLAEAIKKAVSVPVITVGKIWDPSFAETILNEGKADFIALGRALLADPYWVNKAQRGRFDDIRPCIYCNTCLNRAVWPEYGFACTVNPAAVRERDFEFKPARSPKKIWVIGGGIAGIEAACSLSERGHKVTLYEKSAKLGGQFEIAAQQPHKEIYGRFLLYQTRRLTRAGVETILDTEATMEMVKKANPDLVVLATGANPRRPGIPGVWGKNVVLANEVITGKAEVGNRIVVIGAGIVGMEVALQLAEQGRRVSVTEEFRLGGVVPIEISFYRELRNRIIDLGVQFFENSPAKEIREDGVYIAFHDDLVFLKADTIVLAAGVEPNDELAKELKRAGHANFMVGDCVQTRDAMRAIHEGAELALQIDNS